MFIKRKGGLIHGTNLSCEGSYTGTKAIWGKEK